MQQRSGRVTRSQSRGLSDSDFDTRKLIQSSQEPSRNNVNHTGPSSRNHRKDGKRVGKELATVQEQSPEISYPVLAQNLDVLQNHPLREDDHNGRKSKSSSNTSAISENAIPTAFSEPKLTDNDSETMLDALPDLYEAAKKLLSFVAPQNNNYGNHPLLIKDLQYTNSRAYKSLMQQQETLYMQQKSYAKPFIGPTRAVRALLNITHISKVGNGHWPDMIFYEVNLAVMAASLFSPSRSFGDRYQMLKKLQREYPKPFFLQSSDRSSEMGEPIGSSVLFEENSQLWIEIRTQYFISLLDRHSQEPNFDLENMLLQVFNVERDSVRETEISAIEERAKERMHIVQEMFGEDPYDMPDLPAICIELQAVFPWSDFVQYALSWVNLRRNEIETQIKRVGGLDSIVEGIKDDIKSKAPSEAQRPPTEYEIPPPDAEVTLDLPSAQLHYESEQAHASVKAKNTAGKRNLEDLKDKFVQAPKQRVVSQMVAEAKAKQSASKPRALQEQSMKNPVVFSKNNRLDAAAQNDRRGKAIRVVEAPTYGDSFDGFQPQMDQDNLILVDNEDFTHSKRPSVRESVVAGKKEERSFQSQDRLKTQKRARMLVDSQSKKSRFDTDQATSRRSRTEIESEVRRDDRFITISSSEEEGFQDDLRRGFPFRSEPVRSRSRVRPESSSVPPTRHPRVRDESIDLGEELTNTAVTLSQSETYRVANHQSKVKTVLVVPKPVQVRQGWSDEEIERLIDLIEEYGVSWTLLKQKDAENGNVLANRGQVALKDKARNIKYDYLKVGAAMPLNFQHIRLNKALNERLRLAGISSDDE